jgi:outer membrane immunogenic protein
MLRVEGVVKRAALAAFGFAVLAGGSASAADMPVKAADPVPVYSWSGGYLGLGVGARWQNPKWTTDCLGDLCPAPTGFPVDASSPQSYRQAGARVSLYGGYNWQISPTWLMGVEADFAWSNTTKSFAGIPGCAINCIPGFVATTVDSTSIRTTWDASLRARFGVLIAPDWLAYVTGGVALQAIEANAFCTVTGPWCVITRDQTLSQQLWGGTIGTGMEKAWGRWLARVEYRYSSFQSWSPRFFANTVDQFDTTIKLQTHMVNFGIAYKL